MMPQTPPGPAAGFLRGHLAEFGRDRLGFFSRLARDFGPVVSFRLGFRPCLLFSEPHDIEAILVSGSRHFRKHFAVRLNRLLLGNGLLNSEGDFWLRQRRLIQPAFLKERIASYGSTMVSATENLLATWEPGQSRDLHADMMQLTLDIVAQVLFGASVTQDAHAVGAALERALACYARRVQGVVLLPEWLPTATNWRLRKAVGALDQVLYRIIRERRQMGKDRDDLLSLLLHAVDEDDGSRMTDRQLRDEAMTLFLAGHETTALALTWTWYLLANHPEVEERLQAELSKELHGRTPTVADLPRLPFTERVITESMRIYPPVYAIGREAIDPITVGGYPVRPGTTVLMSQWVVHRDVRWFPDPEQFLPDRWTDNLRKQLPHYAYFPFGGGPRVCIGNTFALTEAMLVLATIAQRFRFRRADSKSIKPRAVLTLRPEGGLPVVVEKRAGA